MINYLNLIKNINDDITVRVPTKDKYSKELRAKLVEKAKAIGNVTAASKQLNVPYKTLYDWIKRG